MSVNDKSRSIPYKTAMFLGGAAMSWSMMNQLNSSLWAYFMTDVAMIATTMLATILIAAKALEWVGAIIAGVIMEKTILKWGKYGSWCVVAPPFAALCFVLMFVNPGLSPALTGVWFGLWYSLLMFFVAFITATQTTMVALIGARSRQDRAFLATKRAQGSQVGQFLFGLIGLPIILYINGGIKDAPLGYPVLGIIFGIVCILMYYLLYKNIPEGLDTKYATKEERIAAARDAAKSQSVGVLEMFALLFKTPPMLGIIISDSMRILAQFLLLGCAMYIFTYIYDNTAMFAVMMSSLGITALLTTFFVEFLIRFINNRMIYVGGLTLFALGLAAAYFAATPQMFAICIAISYIGIGFANTNGTAMVGDAAIFCEWKHNKEVKAFMGAMGAMPPKFANLISGALLGFGLISIGFKAKTVMSPETLNGLKMMGTLLPAFCLVIGIACFLLLNNLNAIKLKSINDEVMARRAVATSGEVVK